MLTRQRAKTLDVIRECSACGNQVRVRYNENGVQTILDPDCSCDVRTVLQAGSPTLEEWLFEVGAIVALPGMRKESVV